MQTVLLKLFLILIVPGILFAQAAYVPLNFSFWYPVSFNHSTDDSVNVNFSFLYSHVKRIDGLSLSAGVSVVDRDINGVQINGGFSRVKGNFNGLHVSGAINAHGGRFKGLATAGLVNLVLGDLKGIQLAGAYNFAFGNMLGAQAALFFNVVGNDAKYFQFSVANNVGGSFSGLQFAQVFNFTARTARGMQFALANIAGNLKGVQYGTGNVVLGNALGVQFGLFNFALEQEGLQVGLINSAGEQKGMPFGLINLSKQNGDITWLIYTSNVNALNSGLKFSANNFFSILNMGWYHWNSKSKIKSGISGFHYGYNFILNDQLTIAPDLGFLGILQDIAEDISQDVDPATYRFSFALQSRVILEYNLWPGVKLISGIGLNRVYDIYKEQAIKKSRLVLLAGLSLF